MLRILSFLLLVLVAALGFSWLQDHPGTIALTFGGRVVETTLTVFIIVQLLVVALVLLLAWFVVGLFKAPDRIGRFFTHRRRDKGYRALSAGIIAAGAGDASLARRMAKRSDKLLDNRREPLVRFLDAQTAMIEGDHDRARAAFQAMEADPDTRLLAMRGLYLEAERLGDAGAQRHYAERAARLAPHVPWAGGAVLEAKTVEGDYDGALAILDAQRDARIIDRAESSRLRAVLLTAKARADLERDPSAARKAALEAVSLAPDLTPAAVAAAKASFRLGDLKKGSRVLEQAWEKSPHPAIAEAYVYARPGDSVVDRRRRAETLADIFRSHVETHVMLAHAALDAKDTQAARVHAMAALEREPREGVFLLLADVEEAEGAPEGAVREWLGRAVRAPRDPAWTADGVVASEWAPVSPVTGRLDAFEWKVPAQRLDNGASIEADERVSPERLPSASVPAASVSEAKGGFPDQATGGAMDPASIPAPHAEGSSGRRFAPAAGT